MNPSSWSLRVRPARARRRKIPRVRDAICHWANLGPTSRFAAQLEPKSGGKSPKVAPLACLWPAASCKDESAAQEEHFHEQLSSAFGAISPTFQAGGDSKSRSVLHSNHRNQLARDQRRHFGLICANLPACRYANLQHFPPPLRWPPIELINPVCAPEP